MTLSEMRTFIGIKTAIMSTSGTFVDNLVTATELTTLINVRAKELFWKLAEQHQDHFTTTTTLNLVDGTDTYVFGEDSGDDLSSVYNISYVGIKYASTDTVFTRVERSTYKALFPDSTDSSSYLKTEPYYYKGTTVGGDNSKSRRSLTLVPTPDASVTGGLKLKYTKEIEALSADSDYFETLPPTSHHLIALAVIPDVWEIKGDMTMSDKTYNRYLQSENDFLTTYQPNASDDPIVVQPYRKFNPTSR